MRNLTLCHLLTIGWLALWGAGCSGGAKSKELTALDRAYGAGILTVDEYEAKKAALLNEAEALAALDKAFAAGVFTKDEYDHRRSRLNSAVASLGALEKARRAGVVTTEEYLAKKSALLASNEELPPIPTAPASPQASPRATAQPPPSASASQAPAEDSAPSTDTPSASSTRPAATGSPQAASPDGHSYRMKMVKVMDDHGYERPMVSATMLIPTDWQSEGATTWNLKDSCNAIQTSLRASGPDGRAFEVFPAYSWSWADDPTFLRQSAARKAKLGGHACEVMPPMSAADYVKRNLAKIRPNATLVAIEPAPKLLQLLQDRARKAEQSAAQFRLQQRIRPDAVKAHLKYAVQGQAVEEWIIAVTVTTGTLAPSYNARAMQTTQASSYSCRGTMVAERAPQGQLEASEKFFDLLNSTFRVDQQWQGRVTQGALALQQTRLKGIRDRSAIVAKNADDISKIRREGFENRQKVQDQSAAEFSQVIRGTETYKNPNTGERVELDSNYGHAWVNNRGEYLLSDQAGFDPNVAFRESWTPLQQVKPEP